MSEKRLASGAIAYYWAPPTRAKQAGYPVTSEALGTDYGVAKRRCDEILNPHYKAWLNKGQAVTAANVQVGSFDWMVSIYKASPQYGKLPTETKSSYDRALRIVSDFHLKDGREFGRVALLNIRPAVADKLFVKLQTTSTGLSRVRTAVLSMRVCARAWKIARRADRRVPSENPFEKMGLSYSAKPTRPFRYNELMRFVAAADAAGHQSVGTAAMIAFFWLQREVDILNRLSWSRYRPADQPDVVKIIHAKTGAAMDMPLFAEDGSDLWPELTSRLDCAARHGSLIVTRDKPDRFKNVHLPWKKRHFARVVASIRKAAGIDPEVKFMGLRHGGNTEGGDAGLTDAQLRALSGHKTASMVQLYTKQTLQQRREAARLRRDSRTKGVQSSE